VGATVAFLKDVRLICLACSRTLDLASIIEEPAEVDRNRTNDAFLGIPCARIRTAGRVILKKGMLAKEMAGKKKRMRTKSQERKAPLDF
jgi:hypothetical protein